MADVDDERPYSDEIRRHEIARLEILDAFATTIERREELIRIVGAAADADKARRDLMDAFDLNEAQATAALDLQIRRFAHAERQHIAAEQQDIRTRIESR
jgi:DNA gyrase subunit A